MINIHEASRSDCGAVLKLMDMESGTESAAGSAAKLESLMFDMKLCGALVGYAGNEPFAMCLYRCTADARRLLRGIRIDDVFVTPEYRGGGIGKFILQNMAQKAEREGYDYLEWECAEDSKAMKYCVNAGASESDRAARFRVSGDALHEFGEFKCSCCSGGGIPPRAGV